MEYNLVMANSSITIADVAKMAGVSSMTVSRVLNNNGYVKNNTKEKIEKAITQLNYRPNMVAKSLVTRRTQIIAYIVSDISDPFYNRVSKGIAKSCLNHDYSFIICDATEKRILDSQISMIFDRQIDGVIFHDLNISQDVVDTLLNSGRKIVMLENETDLENVFSIRGDDVNGAKMATKYLLSLGHKRVACLKGPTDKNSIIENLSFQDSFKRKTWIDRTRGYQNALLEANNSFQMYFNGCVESTMGFTLAEEFVNKWMNLDRSNRPTAIYCESDILAFGVLKKALELGISVPKDLAIVGHDGLDMVSMVYPCITTVKQQRFKMGELSADKLISFISSDQQEGKLILEEELYIGQTT